jgi:hypothetical protein
MGLQTLIQIIIKGRRTPENKTKQRRTRDTHKDEKWRKTNMAQRKLQNEIKANENRRPHNCFVKDVM